MSTSTIDQPQKFKDVLVNAILTNAEFKKMSEEEPFRSWNVQATLNFFGGVIRKVEITRISRQDK